MKKKSKPVERRQPKPPLPPEERLAPDYPVKPPKPRKK